MNSSENIQTHLLKDSWAAYLAIVLVIEKIVQHAFVTVAFYFNFFDIRSTVFVDPQVLMVAGAIVAALFSVSLWGMLSRRRWALILVLVLALVDLGGEFLAQGRLVIQINVSFIVALLLLGLALNRLRQKPDSAC